jgi:hypothetical protein
MTGQRTRNTVALESTSENPKKAARIDSAQHERNEETQRSLTISGTRGVVQMARRNTIGSKQNGNCKAAR